MCCVEKGQRVHTVIEHSSSLWRGQRSGDFPFKSSQLKWRHSQSCHLVRRTPPQSRVAWRDGCVETAAVQEGPPK